MTNSTQYEPFAGITQRALDDRISGKCDLERNREHKVPNYFVSMCKALTKAIQDAGNPGVTLEEVIRLERTCTGADYQHKLALRSHRLAFGTEK